MAMISMSTMVLMLMVTVLPWTVKAVEIDPNDSTGTTVSTTTDTTTTSFTTTSSTSSISSTSSTPVSNGGDEITMSEIIYDQVQLILREADTNEDGAISMFEFWRFFSKVNVLEADIQSGKANPAQALLLVDKLVVRNLLQKVFSFADADVRDGLRDLPRAELFQILLLHRFSKAPPTQASASDAEEEDVQLIHDEKQGAYVVTTSETTVSKSSEATETLVRKVSKTMKSTVVSAPASISTTPEPNPLHQNSPHLNSPQNSPHQHNANNTVGNTDKSSGFAKATGKLDFTSSAVIAATAAIVLVLALIGAVIVTRSVLGARHRRRSAHILFQAKALSSRNVVKVNGSGAGGKPTEYFKSEPPEPPSTVVNNSQPSNALKIQNDVVDVEI